MTYIDNPYCRFIRAPHQWNVSLVEKQTINLGAKQ
jgi:hypothetical protein